ncbi:class I SAM-dependent methyltransferase [Colwellia sp. RSH04]|uniref:class I SAM-dependent methyltransferase n=1 Tax=Colwellia sp. RSH04 TaxID=2305464 RepID=UPI000E58CB8B|nr:class I SAM-dependent methyltransferase [Colwellia sp. RSH04]RHW74886.1 class I SAM-dependent methyltransferase [Colwellia sp. RSH04]
MHNKGCNKGFVHNEARIYKGLYLPLNRTNESLSNDVDYIQSSIEQVNSLSHFCSISKTTRLLDFGCGQGRLSNGFLASKTEIARYIGVDTSLESINWCVNWIEKYHSNFKFLHVPAYNARYNPEEKMYQPLPFEENTFDLVFLNSVFSHMLTADIRFYLEQFKRVLSSGGYVYLTAFIEDDVPHEEENPEGYLGRKSKGALHRVRFQKNYFLSLVREFGFTVIEFKHQYITRTCQSVVILKRN